MPPKAKLTKEKIRSAALRIIRERGQGALNARTLAKELSSSTQPIFSNFRGMEEVRVLAKADAYNLYIDFNKRELESSKYPDYKAFGMAYIRFAKEESELFKFIFMCDRTNDGDGWDKFTSETVIPLVMKNLGISRADAEMFQLEMWSFVHGVAVMHATSYFSPDEEMVSRMMSDIYLGISNVYKERKER